MGKVKCPRHDDAEPSAEVYEDGGFCFAGCGPIPLSELGLKDAPRPQERPRENLVAKRNYISALPMGLFRGHRFPFDERGFYILFPGTNYYKQRVFKEDKGPKYRNPSGHSQPLYWARQLSLQTLAIVEGELNAMSIAEAMKDWDVVSPGSAGEFSSKRLSVSLRSLPKYDTVVVVVDKDPAGVVAAIEGKTAALSLADQVKVLLVDRDANDIHEKEGIKALQKDLAERMLKAL